ncbi:hypothetical protein RFI_20480 [Reticulomyxa filosa]|uniref:Uncharacterized protein n=1 Tax=Reticulomyxa filosa TaxID=46433 RepID=X6MT88_RETFI|nr:hypothetical protein RFI_20480 [Reticulomyxa filosa]|eukprot:ETO16856.1 hypothetical protein RFI_20480 [Reticulomyxa filosa]
MFQNHLFGWILQKETWTNTNKKQEEVDKVLENMITQMGNLGKIFEDACDIREQLREEKTKLEDHKTSLDKSAKTVDVLIDKLLAIKG